MTPRSRESVPGARLLSLWPGLAAAAIAFNVFWLRQVHPGFVSGKLSDLGINFLLPIVILSVCEWAWFAVCALRQRRFVPLGTRAVVIACFVSATYFAMLKLLPVFTPVHCALLRVLALPFPVSTAFRNIADPTDVATLVMTPLAWWTLMRAQPPTVHRDRARLAAAE
jgi:hypothetical protein